MNRTAWIIVGLLVGTSVVGPKAQTANENSLEMNKALAHRFHLEVIQNKELELADEIFAPDCVFHMPTSKVTDKKGPERAKEIALGDWKAFPKGLEFAHDQVLAEGNLVAFHWTLTGIRESEEKAELRGLDIVKIENGKVTELWIEWHTIKDGVGL